MRAYTMGLGVPSNELFLFDAISHPQRYSSLLIEWPSIKMMADILIKSILICKGELYYYNMCLNYCGVVRFVHLFIYFLNDRTHALNYHHM